MLACSRTLISAVLLAQLGGAAHAQSPHGAAVRRNLDVCLQGDDALCNEALVPPGHRQAVAEARHRQKLAADAEAAEARDRSLRSGDGFVPAPLPSAASGLATQLPTGRAVAPPPFSTSQPSLPPVHVPRR